MGNNLRVALALGILAQILATVFGALFEGPKKLSDNPEDIKFLYYPEAGKPQELPTKFLESKTGNNIQPGLPTVLLIDGFRSSRRGPMGPALTKALLSHEEKQNVIAVDWGLLSGSTLPLSEFVKIVQVGVYYAQVIQNTGKVADRIVKFLNFLKETKNIPFSKIHLCGHSLGAHISSAVGAIIKRDYNRKVKRISGFDPAGPLYKNAVPIQKLRAGDAEFVDIYHTNRKLFGSDDVDSGDVDIFVNGGDNQPGCRDEDHNANKDMQAPYQLEGYLKWRPHYPFEQQFQYAELKMRMTEVHRSPLLSSDLLKKSGGVPPFPKSRLSPTQQEQKYWCSHSYSFAVFGETVSQNISACPCRGDACFCQKDCVTKCSEPIIVGINMSTSSAGQYHFSYSVPLVQKLKLVFT